MQELRANTEVIVTVGPFVDVGDGFTPQTDITLGGNEAELLKHGATAVVDISGATWAAVTSCRGYYSLTLTAALTSDEGLLTVIVQDDSDCLPVKAEYMVLSEAAYDSKYAAKDAGFMDVNIKTIGRADTQETEANNLESACSNYSVTRGLTGTALPAAVADANNGVVTGDGSVTFTAGVGNIPAVDATALGGTVQSATDLKDFADAGYNPATNKVQGVVLTDTTTAVTNTVNANAVSAIAAFFQDCFTVDSGEVSGAEVSGSLILEVAKVVWDRVLTGVTHNIATSAGRRVRQVEAISVLSSGVAQAGANGTITLAAGENASNNFYNHAIVVITAGTGIGQARAINGYDGGTKVATVVPDWVTNPVNGTEYLILADTEKHVYEVHTGAIDSGSFAAGAINAAAIAAASIDNATFAADVGSTAYATNIIALAVRKVLDELNLDHLLKTAVANNADMTTEVIDGTVLSNIMSSTSDTSTYVVADDSLQGISEGAAGGGATAQEVWEYGTRVLTAGTNLNDFDSSSDTVLLANATMGGSSLVLTLGQLVISNASGIAVDIDGSTATRGAVDIVNNNGVAGSALYLDGKAYGLYSTGETYGGYFVSAATGLAAIGSGGAGLKAWGTDAGIEAHGIANGDGIDAQLAGTGVDIRGDITGNVTGNLSGSVNSVATAVTTDTASRTASKADVSALALETTVDTHDTDIKALLPTALVTGRMSSDAVAISGSTDAADKLEASAETIEIGTATATTLTTTTMSTNLTEVTNDHYNGRVIIWTSGPLIRQATDITDYDGGTKTLTFTAVTESPENGNTFIIV